MSDKNGFLDLDLHLYQDLSYEKCFDLGKKVRGNNMGKGAIEAKIKRVIVGLLRTRCAS
jgi:hypothetical protein